MRDLQIYQKNSKIIWVWTVPKKNYYDFPNVWTVSEPEENHKGRVKLWPQRGWDLTARSHFGPATMLLPSTGKSPYLLFIVHTCVHTLPTLRTYIPTYLDTCIPNMPTYLPTYRIRTYIHNRIFTYAQRKCVKYKRINKYITNIIYIMYIYIYIYIYIFTNTNTLRDTMKLKDPGRRNSFGEPMWKHRPENAPRRWGRGGWKLVLKRQEKTRI